MATTPDVYFVGNTMVVQLGSAEAPLKDPITGVVENNADVSCTIVDADGVTLTGETFPLTMPWAGAGEPGVYRASVSYNLALGNKERATVKVTADIGGTRYYGEIIVKGTIRTGDTAST